MGTKNALKKQIQKTHTRCIRCGRTSYHIQKKVCSACGYPSARNRHSGEIPLVGGLAIFLTLVLGGVLWGDSNATPITVKGTQALWVFMGCGAFLVVTGALDDRFHLGVFMRVLS